MSQAAPVSSPLSLENPLSLVFAGGAVAMKTVLGVVAVGNPVVGGILGLTWGLGTLVVSPAVDWACDQMGVGQNPVLEKVMKVALSILLGAAIGVLATIAATAVMGVPISFVATLGLMASMITMEFQICIVVSGCLACFYAGVDWLLLQSPNNGADAMVMRDSIPENSVTMYHNQLSNFVKNDNEMVYASRCFPVAGVGMAVIDMLASGSKIRRTVANLS